MQSDAALPLALAAVALAVLAVLAALSATLLGRRARRGLRGLSAAGAALEPRTRTDARLARGALDRVAEDVRVLDGRLGRATDLVAGHEREMRRVRAGLARVSPLGLDRAVGMAHALILISRLALVWRTPTR